MSLPAKGPDGFSACWRLQVLTVGARLALDASFNCNWLGNGMRTNPRTVSAKSECRTALAAKERDK